MNDHTYNIAEAKMHLSRLIERVESGEHITIARNGRPVALVSPVLEPPEDTISRIRAVRESIKEKNGGTVLKPGETWRDFIEEGRRI